MSLIKSFGDFLFEGKYDSLTGKISAAVMQKIKETNNGEEYFDGVKVIYGPGDDVPSFNSLIEDGKYLEVDLFVDPVLNENALQRLCENFLQQSISFDLEFAL